MAGGGLKLVQEEERFVYKGDGYEIFYRRVPSTIRDSYIKKHTPRRGGDPDWTIIGKLMLEYALVDWSGIFEETDGQRTDIPFDREKVRFIPEDVRTDIIEKLGADAASLERAVKNLPTMHASNGITEG